MPDHLKHCVVKLYVLQAHIPLRPLDTVSSEIKKVGTEPE
jgi:hypothetical protein